MAGVAVQDREYMRNCRNDDLFMLSEDQFLEGKLIKEHLPEHANEVLTPRQAREMARLPGYPWEYKTYREESWKLVLAGALGTMLLIVPMILMLFAARHMGTRVAVVTSFTVVFAAGVVIAAGFANGLKPTPMELFQATAAYTAILVVFVGTTS